MLMDTAPGGWAVDTTCPTSARSGSYISEEDDDDDDDGPVVVVVRRT